MKKLIPAICVSTLGLVMCRPASGTQPTTTSTTTGGSSGAIPCENDQQCQAILDAGNCFDAGSGAFCDTCATNSDCASLGTNLVCTAETCVDGPDAGPAAGHCYTSCNCMSGQACLSTTTECGAPPTRCESNNDCPCNAICDSQNCLLTCNPDAGNADCANPTPKCYATFGRCGFCSPATDAGSDCPTGQSCLPNGSCGIPQAATTSSSGSGTTGTHSASTTSGSTSSPTGGSVGGLIGGTSPIGGLIGASAPIGGILGGTSPLGGLLGGSGGSSGGSSSGGITTCDSSTCSGCSSSDTCFCPALPPTACVPTGGCGGLPGICIGL